VRQIADGRPTLAHERDLDRFGSETILVVEDQEILRTLISVILGRFGYRVLLAADGKTALEMAARESIDLLLTDVVMPGQAGFELAEAIRTTTPNLPVVFMSGYTAAALEDRRPVPADDTLLEKPFTPQSLGRAIRLALGRRCFGPTADSRQALPSSTSR
jgi:two-component system cell cycle sensor histidine kinase/response regulator CckA